MRLACAPTWTVIPAASSPAEAQDQLAAIGQAQEEARAQRTGPPLNWPRPANTAQAYRRYLRDHPDGAYVAEAEARLNALVEPDTDPAAPVTSDDQARAQEEALGLNRATAQLIEARLEQMGLDVGEVDGRFNNRNPPRTGPVSGGTRPVRHRYLDELTLITVLADTMTTLN